MKKPARFDGLALTEMLYKDFDSPKISNSRLNSQPFQTYESFKSSLDHRNLSPEEYELKIQKYCKKRGI